MLTWNEDDGEDICDKTKAAHCYKIQFGTVPSSIQSGDLKDKVSEETADMQAAKVRRRHASPRGSHCSYWNNRFPLTDHWNSAECALCQTVQHSLVCQLRVYKKFSDNTNAHHVSTWHHKIAQETKHFIKQGK
jgi:hypothetical protein